MYVSYIDNDINVLTIQTFQKTAKERSVYQKILWLFFILQIPILAAVFLTNKNVKYNII